MTQEAIIIAWDGTGTPEVFRTLPPGRYLIQPADDFAPLTLEEERGLLEAMEALDRGEGIPLEEVLERLSAPIGES
jgi:hypothetical protein